MDVEQETDDPEAMILQKMFPVKSH